MPKVATAWFESCAGCHMSFLDMDERVIDLVKLGVTFSASPVTDLKVPEDDVDIGIIEGSIGNTAHEEEAKMMREKCKIIIALGDCAVFGGIPTMRNRFDKREVLEKGYYYAETNHNKHIPSSEDISKLLDKVKAVNEVIKVDYYIPGCPPPPDSIFTALVNLVEGKKPELKGRLLTYDE